jgi:hypothetical protein
MWINSHTHTHTHYVYLHKINNISIIILTYEATQQNILMHYTVTHHTRILRIQYYTIQPSHIKMDS